LCPCPFKQNKKQLDWYHNSLLVAGADFEFWPMVTAPAAAAEATPPGDLFESTSAIGLLALPCKLSEATETVQKPWKASGSLCYLPEAI